MATPDWTTATDSSQYKNDIDSTAQDHEDRITVNEADIADHETRISDNESAIAALNKTYVALDTPVNLVSSSSLSTTNWTTINNATLAAALASTAKLRITIEASDNSMGAVPVELFVFLAKSGKSGAPDTSTERVFIAAKTGAWSDSASKAYGSCVVQADVNLDASYDFQYGISVAFGGWTGIQVYIDLIGYYK